MEVIKTHAAELLNRQQVQTLIENLAKTQPALVEEVVPKMFSYGEIQKVLTRLLRENIPIKNLATILETLAEYGSVTKNPDELTELVRQSLSRVITGRFLTGDDVAVLALDAKLEQLIAEKTKKTETGLVTVLEPNQLQAIFTSLKTLLERFTLEGKRVVVLTAPAIRPRFKKLIEQVAPGVPVLSYAEIDPNLELHIEGVIKAA